MSDAYVEQSKDYIRYLGERHEPNAIARMLRISPGSLQNIWRGRLKSIPVDLYVRLCNAVSREMRAEIGRLEARLAVVDEGAGRLGDREVAQMAAQIERMSLLIKERA